MGLLSMLRPADRHPMHSAAAAAELIALIPADNLLRALNEVTQWLRSVGEAPGFKPSVRLEVLGLLDDAGRKPERAMVLRYLKDPRLRNPGGRVASLAMIRYWANAACHSPSCSCERPRSHLVSTALGAWGCSSRKWRSKREAVA